MAKIKNYKQALDYIYSKLPIFQSQGPKALKYNLDNIINLCAAIGNPQNKFKSIHIAGTNGKGTTSHIIASVFQEAGYKTGLYTSPHYKDFRERVKINGKLIKKSFLTNFISENIEIIEKLKPSYFELSVALAFSYFAKKKVDIAIIEVGLGGRLDSTNIITPLLSLITNISYDHTQTLGNTLTEIAKEKAGIIKKNIPVVIGEKQEECISSYQKLARKKMAPLYYSDDILIVKEKKRNLKCTKLSIFSNSLKIKQLKTDIVGPFSKTNIKYALSALDIFIRNYNKEWEIKPENITKGIRHVKKNTKYIGRWHLVSKSPDIIADGAHNIGALKETIKYISNSNYTNLHIVIGIVADKSWNKVFKILPKDAKYYFTKANIPRAMNESELQKLGKKYKLLGKKYKNVFEAKSDAIKSANNSDLILIIGSIYLVGEIL